MARHSDERSKFIQLLSENPSISAACHKVGIGRATVYRWIKNDPDFKTAVDLALIDGRKQWIEMTELALVREAKKGNVGAIKYFLSNNEVRYLPKVPVEALPPEGREEWERRKKESVPTYHLSEEQTDNIIASLERFGLLKDGKFTENLIKTNPELFLQWIREDEELRRQEKREKFFKGS